MNQDSIVLLINQLDAIKTELTNFLTMCGVTPKTDKISGLLEQLSEVRVIKPKTKYIAVGLSDSGHVADVVVTDNVADYVALPLDIKRGYYLLEDGRFIIDKARKAYLWGE